MSYILEALKKSENERKREEIPGLGADHSQYYSVREERRSPMVKNLFIFTLLLFGVAGSGWWFFQGKPSIEVTEEPEAAVVPAPALSAPAETVEAVPTSQTSIQTTADIPDDVEALTEVPVIREPMVVDSVSDLVADNFVVPLFEELPEDVRDRIPPLTFAGHVYASEKQKRMIMINMRIVREGAMVEPDLILVEIEANGVVLRYSEVAFRVNLF